MYQKYHTEALVLGSRESGESDRTIALYTEVFGLVWARASAVRTESSKMRTSLQHYSRVRVSLVKGKRGWRAAGASAYAVAPGASEGVAAFARIASLALRLVHGEEQNRYLFETLAHAHHSLVSAPVRSVGTVELLCVARVLYALGYVSAEAVDASLFSHAFYQDDALTTAKEHEGTLVRLVNRAITEARL